jgi:hypothetical protein
MHISGVDVLSFLAGRNSLLDAKLASLFICERDDSVAVELFFTARRGAEYDRIRLGFECVMEFDFTYSSDYTFGNVEGLKFAMTDDGQFYLSIDPDPSSNGPCKEDRDFVRAMKIWAEVNSR